MPLEVEWVRGVSVKYGDTRVVFDPQKRVMCEKVFISHAHLDHAKASVNIKGEKVSTEETKQIIGLYKRRIYGWKSLSYNERIRFGDLEVVAHNAGHVLGSSLYEINTPEGTVLYTGDFQYNDSFTLKSAEAVDCDVLILEATFGAPSFIFPSREEVASSIVRWAEKVLAEGRVPTFKADSLGNAQEIVKIFNLFTSLPVVVYPTIAKINEIYNSCGCKLNFCSLKSEEGEEIIERKNGVLIVPKASSRYLDPKLHKVALVSGWALTFGKRYGASFPLSDHADFPQLIDYTEACKPKIVLTCFGKKFNNILARQIEKKLGVEARPIELIKNEIYLSSKPSYL